MSASEPFAEIKHILCPTDLTARSQNTLSFAAQIAATLGAKLTAFHSAVDSWLYHSEEQFREGKAEIECEIERVIAASRSIERGLLDLDVVVEKSSDPASAIPRLARELNAGMIVMKTRPGVASAFHFGSIVERVINVAPCPVLLFPPTFFTDHDPEVEKLSFGRILFDYDFSQATEDLFHVANLMAREYAAELHVLSVLEPPTAKGVEFATPFPSRFTFQSAVRSRLRSVIRSEGISPNKVPMTVEWGSHADKVLRYAKRKHVDLICTVLPEPKVFPEKIYRSYFGKLLASAPCPVLLEQCV